MLPGCYAKFLIVALGDELVNDKWMPYVSTSFVLHSTQQLRLHAVKKMGLKLQYYAVTEMLHLLLIVQETASNWKLLMVQFGDHLCSHELGPTTWASKVSCNTKLLHTSYVKIMDLKVQYYTGQELLLLLLIVYGRRNNNQTHSVHTQHYKLDSFKSSSWLNQLICITKKIDGHWTGHLDILFP